MDMSRRIKNYIEMRFASYHGLTFTTTAGIIRNGQYRIARIAARAYDVLLCDRSNRIETTVPGSS